MRDVPADPPLPRSPHTFADGARHRVEIASVEGPEVLEAVLDEAGRRGVRVHRASQGSGVAMLDDDEIRRMAALGRAHEAEVCLFLTPRGAWDIGGQALRTDAAAGVARGGSAVRACVEEARRAVALGIRCLLVGDVGVLDVLGALRADGELPADLRLKSSAILCVANGASARLLARLGADSVNAATDLDLRVLAGIRAATDVPLDVYVEAPDDMGGFVRAHEVAELVAVASPVYLKFGLRNATSVYPSGGHLLDVAIRQAREKVRRAGLALAALEAG